MQHRQRRPARLARNFALAALPLAVVQAHAAQSTAVWTSASSGSYGTATNWSIGRVPLNDAVNSYIAQISGVAAVSYGVLGNNTVDQLLLDNGVAFNLSGSSFITPTGLTVLGRALIGGTISASNASFSALAAGTAFAGTRNAISVSNGGVVALSAAQFNASGFQGGTILGAQNEGSRIELDGTTVLNAGAAAVNSNYTNAVRATDKAVIKIARLKTVVAPSFSGGTLAFSADAGASIDLSSLETVQGVTVDSGLTNFNSSGGSITLGAMTTANRMFVNLAGSATMTVAGSPTATAQVTNSTFSAVGGSQLLAGGWKGEYHAQGFQGRALMAASNASTLLDLSGIVLIDSAAAPTNSNYTNTVSATDKAAINLSGVRTVVAPSFGGGTLSFAANAGAWIDLSSLNAVQGFTIDSGNTVFSSDGGSIALGTMQSVNRMTSTLANGAVMTIAGATTMAQISNSTFIATSGAKLLASGWNAEYHAQAFQGRTLMSAANAGTVLDLSGLRLIDSGAAALNANYTNAVNASDRALINLSGVQAVVAPSFSGGALTFAASGGAGIELSSLQTIRNPAGGQVNFNASSGGAITLHGLAAGPAVRFNLVDAGSTLSMLGGLSLLAGSSLSAGTGTHLDLRGSFSFEQQQSATNAVNLDQAIVSFVGAATATLEIGGASTGVPTVGTVVRNNFAIGQLVIEQQDTAAFVALADDIDNGNRRSPEVLYLNGIGGGNGLRLLGGSTLVLDGFDVYALDNGQWTHLNDLFQNGATRIAYDQGFLALAVPEPATWALWLAGFGVLTLLGRRRGPGLWNQQRSLLHPGVAAGWPGG